MLFISTFLDTNSPILVRKRQRRPENWVRNINKKLRESGKTYTNHNGIEKPNKIMKPPCQHTCFYLCSKIFSTEQRKTIFDDFWSLSDDEKGKFYVKFVKRVPVKRRRSNTTEKKSHSFQFFLEVGDKIQRVCRTFFVNTLGIDQKRIYYCFSNLTIENSGVPLPRKKGKYTKWCTPPEKVEEVRQHIRSFPTMESHYCRASSEKKYLPPDLTLAKMFRYYLEDFKNPVKISLYRKIFNSEFNLAFHTPKKDQ